MYTATLIRHRWETHSILNGRVDKVEHEDHFKVVFSEPTEMKKFMEWCEKNEGEYKYNRSTNKQEGEVPEKIIEIFPEEVGWCDVIEFYLLHVAGYDYHSSLHPFKGKVFTKDEWKG